MSPREMIRKEYGESRNLITPRRLGVGSLPFGAYELSSGRSLQPGETVYGVSVVELKGDGTTERVRSLSACFHSRAAALDYVRSLRRMKAVPAPVETA